MSSEYTDLTKEKKQLKPVPGPKDGGEEGENNVEQTSTAERDLPSVENVAVQPTVVAPAPGPVMTKEVPVEVQQPTEQQVVVNNDQNVSETPKPEDEVQQKNNISTENQVVTQNTNTTPTNTEKQAVDTYDPDAPYQWAYDEARGVEHNKAAANLGMSGVVNYGNRRMVSGAELDAAGYKGYDSDEAKAFSDSLHTVSAPWGKHSVSLTPITNSGKVIPADKFNKYLKYLYYKSNGDEKKAAYFDDPKNGGYGVLLGVDLSKDNLAQLDRLNYSYYNTPGHDRMKEGYKKKYGGGQYDLAAAKKSIEDYYKDKPREQWLPKDAALYDAVTELMTEASAPPLDDVQTNTTTQWKAPGQRTSQVATTTSAPATGVQPTNTGTNATNTGTVANTANVAPSTTTTTNNGGIADMNVKPRLAQTDEEEVQSDIRYKPMVEYLSKMDATQLQKVIDNNSDNPDLSARIAVAAAKAVQSARYNGVQSGNSISDLRLDPRKGVSTTGTVSAEDIEKENEKAKEEQRRAAKQNLTNNKELNKGNVNVGNLPVVSKKRMEEAGWSDVDGDTSMHLQIRTIKDSKGNEHQIAINPILEYGGILTPEEVNQYVSILDGRDNFLEFDKSFHNAIVSTDMTPEKAKELGALVKSAYEGQLPSVTSSTEDSGFDITKDPEYQKLDKEHKEKLKEIEDERRRQLDPNESMMAKLSRENKESLEAEGLDPESEKRRQKRRRTESLIANIGDLLQGIINSVGTLRGAKSAELSSLSASQRATFEKEDEKLDKRRAALEKNYKDLIAKAEAAGKSSLDKMVKEAAELNKRMWDYHIAAKKAYTSDKNKREAELEKRKLMAQGEAVKYKLREAMEEKRTTEANKRKSYATDEDIRKQAHAGKVRMAVSDHSASNQKSVARYKKSLSGGSRGGHHGGGSHGRSTHTHRATR